MDQRAFAELASPHSLLFKALLKYASDPAFLYEIYIDRLPPTIEKLLNVDSHQVAQLPPYYQTRLEFQKSSQKQDGTACKTLLKLSRF